MNPKAKPLVLTMYTLVCVIIPAAGVIPSAIALEDTTSLDEDLARGIVSDVLDSVDDEEENVDGSSTTAGDGDTNTQIAVPIITQDQREANLAAQSRLNVDIVEKVEEVVTPTPTPTPVEDTTPPTLKR